MNKLLLMLVLMVSSPAVLAHGSSHPSCTDINTGVRYKYDDQPNAYQICKQERSAYYARRYQECTEDIACRTERENNKLIMMILMGFFGFAFVGLIILMCYEMDRDLNEALNKKW